MTDRTNELARPSTIPALDAMRFVGVLAVMGTHVGFQAGTYTTAGLLGHLTSRLNVGVAIFFVLSGFLLSREWLVRARAEQPTPTAKQYYVKRFWRIYPAYAIVALVVLSSTAANRDRWPGGWISTLLMIDPYTTKPLPDGFTQTWSLTTEVAFYAVLPALMWLLIGARLNRLRVALVLGASVTISLVWLAGLGGQLPFAGRPVDEWLPAYLSWFAAGIGLAVLHAAPDLFPKLARAVRTLAASPGVCTILALALLLISSTQIAGPWLLLPLTRPEEVTRHVLFGLIGVLLIVPAAFGNGTDSRWVRLLSRPFPRHLGHVSYSIFLTHMAILQFVAWLFGYPLFQGHFVELFVLTLAGSLLVSELLYRFVERPFTRLGRRTTTAPTSTPSAAAAR